MKFIPFNRRAAMLGVMALAACAASAQENVKTIRLMVGYSAGGPVDQTARLLAPSLGKELGVSIIVENKTGANATLAGDAVAKAKPDGSVLWFAASPTVTISPNVMRKMPFDPAKDLAPVAPVLSYYNVLVINKDLPFQNVKSLVDFAKVNPGKLTYGSAGTGGSNHLCGELFADRTGTKLNHIPYKGNAPAMTDVIGGTLTMMFDIVGSARPFIASGNVKALAVTSPKRNPSLPNVPTMAESGLSGLAGFDVGGWYGVYAPPGAPEALVTRYNQAINKVLALPEVKEKLQEMGYELWSGAPKVLADRGNKERAMWATVTKGIEIE
jgi:tripartite-type tricarboxylate transporter receptor subunit TctC